MDSSTEALVDWISWLMAHKRSSDGLCGLPTGYGAPPKLPLRAGRLHKNNDDGAAHHRQ